MICTLLPATDCRLLTRDWISFLLVSDLAFVLMFVRSLSVTGLPVFYGCDLEWVLFWPSAVAVPLLHLDHPHQVFAGVGDVWMPFLISRGYDSQQDLSLLTSCNQCLTTWILADNSVCIWMISFTSTTELLSSTNASVCQAVVAQVSWSLFRYLWYTFCRSFLCSRIFYV